jgi:hypothetical protein
MHAHFKIKENMNMNYKTLELIGASPKLLNKQRRIKKKLLKLKHTFMKCKLLNREEPLEMKHVQKEL